jgi:uncharacterized protein YegL
LEENVFVHGLGEIPFWIGFNDMYHENEFIWSDGTIPNYANWSPGQPDNHKNEDCVEIWKPDGTWNDNQCNGKKAFICKAHATFDHDPPEPLKFDTCPPDWTLEGHSCYLTVKTEKTFKEASQHCIKEGAHLASCHSKEENDFLVKRLSSQWLGLTDVANEGTFVWTDGTKLDFTNWGVGEPNDHGGKEDCTHTGLNKDKPHLWNDIDCERKYAFHCKKSPTPADIEDVKVAECPEGTFGFMGACYFGGHEKAEFWTAQANCLAKGADLVSITNAAENEFLKMLAADLKLGSFFIGLTDVETEGEFFWLDGTVKEFTKWSPGEPNDAGHNEDCTEMYSNGNWNDIHCTALRNYMCKLRDVDPSVLPDPADDVPCNEIMDVAFVIDESGTIGEENFEIMKGFLADMVDQFEVGPEGVRIGAMKYSLFFRLTLLNDLKVGSDPAAIKEAILKTNYGRGGTATGVAMRYARDKILHEARVDAQPVVIVFTDGNANMGVSPLIAGNELREDGYTVIAVGFGDEVNHQELADIGGSEEHILHLDSYETLLANEALKKKIKKLVCNPPE